jgi:hypothetical protein
VTTGNYSLDKARPLTDRARRRLIGERLFYDPSAAARTVGTVLARLRLVVARALVTAVVFLAGRSEVVFRARCRPLVELSTAAAVTSVVYRLGPIRPPRVVGGPVANFVFAASFIGNQVPIAV